MVDTLAQLLARTRANTPHPGADIGIRPTDTGFVPYLKRRGGGSGSGSRRDHLQPYIFKEGENQKIAITPGFFGAIIPTFAGGSLTDIPAPSVTLIAPTQLWLVVEWEPASEEDAGLHWIMPGGNLISAHFEISESTPSETAPNVTEAGVITNGVFSILWGDISETDGKFNLDSYRSENRQPGFCPPNNLEYPIG